MESLKNFLFLKDSCKRGLRKGQASFYSHPKQTFMSESGEFFIQFGVNFPHGSLK